MKEFIGKAAPDFSLEDQNGTVRSLADYAGKYLLLYFYPKDNTPGCTIEAKNFSDMKDELEAAGAAVVGVSVDDTASHKKFESSCDLTITLLADVDKITVEAYDVWQEKNMFGRKYMGIMRDSFLIDPTGIVVKRYKRVKPKVHAQEVLRDLQELQQPAA